MKNLVFLLITIIGIICYTNAQNPQWLNYTNGDNIYTLAEEGNDVWVGTNGGLVRFDKTTGIPTYFNNSNSSLVNAPDLCNSNSSDSFFEIDSLVMDSGF